MDKHHRSAICKVLGQTLQIPAWHPKKREAAVPGRDLPGEGGEIVRIYGEGGGSGSERQNSLNHYPLKRLGLLRTQCPLAAEAARGRGSRIYNPRQRRQSFLSPFQGLFIHPVFTPGCASLARGYSLARLRRAFA